MLVVLAIIGFAFAAAPAVIAGLDSLRLRAASYDVMALLREARAIAARGEVTTEMVLSLDRPALSLAGTGRASTLPAVVQRMSIEPAGLIDPERRAHIRFFPDGSATPARIALVNRSMSITIVVDWLTGRVWHDG